MTRTAIVTGGTGGLGTAVTAKLLDDGWKVVVPWRDEQKLERIGSHERLALIEADLSDEQSVAAVVAEAGAQLTAVVNLVGGFAAGGLVHETPIAALDHQLEVNLRPTYLVSAAALPALLEHETASIVCIASQATLEPWPGVSGYVVAKAAVLALVDVLDTEYREQGIRANTVLPGLIDTPTNREDMPDADFSAWVQPAEIADVIASLISDEGKAIAGSRLKVYGSV